MARIENTLPMNYEEELMTNTPRKEVTDPQVSISSIFDSSWDSICM